jgi:hypothetical protein
VSDVRELFLVAAVVPLAYGLAVLALRAWSRWQAREHETRDRRQ